MFKNLFSYIDNTNLICGLTLLIYLSLVTFTSAATPFEPSNNVIVASWKSATNSTSTTLQSVTDHLQQAQFPGQANIHHSMARATLRLLADQQQRNSMYWYLLARSLQHQHEFDQALTALDEALRINANFPSAWLLKANIHIAQSDFIAAKKACTQLIGNIDLLTVAICSLEVASYEGKLAQSYAQLSSLIMRSDIGDYSADEQFWGIQVIADMALRLGKIKLADQWIAKALNSRQLSSTPLSLITLWADIQRELEKHQNIVVELSAILQQVSFKDDALLVRLAMAEKAANNANRLDEFYRWQEQIARRVKLRVQRHDLYHAADIARYYIYVQPSPKEALKWANINYQQAKLYDDQQLLLEAKRLNGINGEEGENYVSG